MLTGVSVTWYTWLEQAREMSVSRQVIEALARVLRLPANRA
jgi:Helix-turn-helix domain